MWTGLQNMQNTLETAACTLHSASCSSTSTLILLCRLLRHYLSVIHMAILLLVDM